MQKQHYRILKGKHSVRETVDGPVIHARVGDIIARDPHDPETVAQLAEGRILAISDSAAAPAVASKARSGSPVAVETNVDQLAAESGFVGAGDLVAVAAIEPEAPTSSKKKPTISRSR